LLSVVLMKDSVYRGPVLTLQKFRMADLCRRFAIWLFGYLKYPARWRAGGLQRKAPHRERGFTVGSHPN